MGEFQQSLERRDVTHWWTYPKSPKMNAHVERFSRTLQKSMVDYHEDLLSSDLGGFNQELAEWLVFYNAVRPHESLNMMALLEYIARYHAGEA